MDYESVVTFYNSLGVAWEYVYWVYLRYDCFERFYRLLESLSLVVVLLAFNYLFLRFLALLLILVLILSSFIFHAKLVVAKQVNSFTWLVWIQL